MVLKLGLGYSSSLSKLMTENPRPLPQTGLDLRKFPRLTEKQKSKVKEKLEQPIKEKLLEFCYLLDMPGATKTWVVGKWITPGQQRWAPPGTRFYQFVVPPIWAFRRDCSYGDLAAMKLPDDVEGVGCCEYTMGRGIVHACHAGGVVHSLEGWTHHEVGALDIDRIEVVWKAAMKHGFHPVSSLPK